MHNQDGALASCCTWWSRSRTRVLLDPRGEAVPDPRLRPKAFCLARRPDNLSQVEAHRKRSTPKPPCVLGRQYLASTASASCDPDDAHASALESELNDRSQARIEPTRELRSPTQLAVPFSGCEFDAACDTITRQSCAAEGASPLVLAPVPIPAPAAPTPAPAAPWPAAAAPPAPPHPRPPPPPARARPLLPAPPLPVARPAWCARPPGCAPRRAPVPRPPAARIAGAAVGACSWWNGRVRAHVNKRTAHDCF
jgi:hypothetical protein